jgi:hypothetical protein
MSRHALAWDAEVDNSWLRRFETGKSGIRVEALIAIAQGMKVPAGAIITAMGKGPAKPEEWLQEYAKNHKSERLKIHALAGF